MVLIHLFAAGDKNETEKEHIIGKKPDLFISKNGNGFI